MEAHRRSARFHGSSPCGEASRRRGWRGSRSRPRNSRGRTASGRRGRRPPLPSGAGCSTIENRPERALEVALPERVAGIALEPGMERRARPRAGAASQPRHGERARLVALEPDARACAGRAVARKMSSGPAHRPMSPWKALRRRHMRWRWPRPTPNIASEWPTIYLVPAWTTMSAPWPSGVRKSGVAQVLSMMTVAPCAMRRRRDRRHVLHLEGQRARRFADRRPRVRRGSAPRCRRRPADRSRWSRCRCAPGRVSQTWRVGP